MALAPYEHSFNGLVIGGNTNYAIQQVDGLRSMPEGRKSDTDRARQDGSFGGVQPGDERTITYTITIVSPSGLAQYEADQAALAAAFAPIPDPTLLLPLQFYLAPGWGSPRQVLARPTKVDIPITKNQSIGYAAATIEMLAPDPVIYSPVASTASTGLPVSGAGLTFNAHFNAIFGYSMSALIACDNSGNYTTFPTFTITGPCINPIVTNTATDAAIGYTITLSAGDTLVIDTKNHVATLNGTASRSNLITPGSTWFAFPEGTTTVAFSSGDSSFVAARLTASWQSAWAMP